MVGTNNKLKDTFFKSDNGLSNNKQCHKHLKKKYFVNTLMKA